MSGFSPRRIVLRSVGLLAGLVGVLFVVQAFLAAHLEREVRTELAELRERGVLGPTNSLWGLPGDAAQEWVETLRRIVESVRANERPSVAEALTGGETKTLLPHRAPLTDFERLLASGIPPGAAFVRHEPVRITLSITVLHGGRTTSGSLPNTDRPIGLVAGLDEALLAEAAHRSTKVADTRAVAHALGTVLDLLHALDDGSLADGELRQQRQKLWLEAVAALRARPELDAVALFEHLDPKLARDSGSERLVAPLVRNLEIGLGHDHLPWHAVPPALAVFERSQKLSRALERLAALRGQLDYLDRLPAPTLDARTLTEAIRLSRKMAASASSRVTTVARRSSLDRFCARQLALLRLVLAADAQRAVHGEAPGGIDDLRPWFPDGLPVDPLTRGQFVLRDAGGKRFLEATSPGATRLPGILTASSLTWPLLPESPQTEAASGR